MNMNRHLVNKGRYFNKITPKVLVLTSYETDKSVWTEGFEKFGCRH